MLFVTALMAVLLTGCAPREPRENGDLKILATIGIIGDVLQKVAGQNVDVITLLPPRSEAHGFAPTPQDLVAIAESDLIFINGLGLEDSLIDFFEDTSSSAITIRLSEEMQLDDSNDPHVWPILLGNET